MVAKVVIFLAIGRCVKGKPRETGGSRFVSTVGDVPGLCIVDKRGSVAGPNHPNFPSNPKTQRLWATIRRSRGLNAVAVVSHLVFSHVTHSPLFREKPSHNLF